MVKERRTAAILQRSVEAMGEKRTTEQMFQAYLRGGEQVRWHGTTKPFPLLERDARFLILGEVDRCCACIRRYFGIVHQ